MKRQSGHRCNIATLNKLAEDYVYYELDAGQQNKNLFPLSWNIARVRS